MYEQHVITLDKLSIFARHVENRGIALHLLTILHPHFKVNHVIAEEGFVSRIASVVVRPRGN